MKTLNDKEQFDQVVKRALERDQITARKMFTQSGIAQMKEKEKEKNVRQNSSQHQDKPVIID
jgi:hypothetical protein